MIASLKWIIGAVLLVAVIAGARVLYNRFANDSFLNGGQETKQEDSDDVQSTSPLDSEPDAQDSEPSGDSADIEDTEAQTEKKEPIVLEKDFTVTDMNGNSVKLSDMAGKPIVLNFWATWCGACNSEMPAFDAMYKKYGDDVCFMMINNGESKSQISAYITSNGYSFPVYLDTTYEAIIAYGTRYLPTSVFIDKNGVVAKTHTGAMTSAQLEEQIKKIS